MQMSSDKLLRDIFKIPLNASTVECYRILGYHYMHMYQLHIKYDTLRSHPRNSKYYMEKQRLKLLQSQIPIDYTIIQAVFYHVLKKNL